MSVEVSKNIVQKHNVVVNKNIEFISNVPITEFDIKDAGFTILSKAKLLPNTLEERIKSVSKKQKNIIIGKFLRDNKDINKYLMDSFIRLRQNFVEANNIMPEEILCIKKDAIYLIRKFPYVLNIDEVEFVRKSEFSTYFYANRKEFYYSSKMKKLVVKGFSNSDFQFFKDIETILKLSEKLEKKDLLMFVRDYRDRYLNFELPIDTYRNVDSGRFDYGNFELTEINSDFKDDIDISYNYITYLLPLIKNII